MFGFTGNPSHYIKLFIHSTLAILSFTQINSDSVDLHEINFCLVELLIIAPFTIMNTDPVWLFMLACNANATPVYHVNLFVSLDSNVNILFIFLFKKITTQNISSNLTRLRTWFLRIENKLIGKYRAMIYYTKHCLHHVSVNYATPLFVKLLGVFLIFHQLLCLWCLLGCHDLTRELF